MGFIKEFKEFALKGNVIDLAIGVIIGAAFSSIATSLVEHVITPLIVKPLLDAARLDNLSDLTVLGTVKIGLFLSAVISFLIVAFVLFLIVRSINKLKKKEEAAPAPNEAASTTDKLLIEIRDLLKK